MAKPNTMPAGTCAFASFVDAYAKSSKAGTSWSKSLRCSARMPDKTGAPPRFESRSAEATDVGPSWMPGSAWCSGTSGGMAVRG